MRFISEVILYFKNAKVELDGSQITKDRKVKIPDKDGILVIEEDVLFKGEKNITEYWEHFLSLPLSNQAIKDFGGYFNFQYYTENGGTLTNTNATQKRPGVIRFRVANPGDKVGLFTNSTSFLFGGMKYYLEFDFRVYEPNNSDDYRIFFGFSNRSKNYPGTPDNTTTDVQRFNGYGFGLYLDKNNSFYAWQWRNKGQDPETFGSKDSYHILDSFNKGWNKFGMLVSETDKTIDLFWNGVPKGTITNYLNDFKLFANPKDRTYGIQVFIEKLKGNSAKIIDIDSVKLRMDFNS